MADQPEHPAFPNVGRLEAEIGLMPGFLAGLLNDGDDWSFVLKVNALAEAAVTHLLTAAAGREESREQFAFLPMGGRRGKLAEAGKLRLLDPRRVAFFRALGRIRNRYAHDVKNVGLPITECARQLPSGEQPHLWRDLMRGHTIEPVIIDFAGQKVLPETFASAHPRFTIWVSSMTAMSIIYRTKTFDPENRQKLFEFLSTMKPLRTE